MLVGQPPFVSEGFGDLVNMHLNMQPASPRSKRPEIPLALDALVLKMLAKNPDDRYQEMKEVQSALKASGGSQITSSPNLAGTHGKGSSMPMPALATQETAYSTGSGRVVTETVRGGNGKKILAGVFAAAAIAGGFFWWQSGRE